MIIEKIVVLGLPIGLQDFLVGASFLVVLAIVNSLGLIASAGVGVAEKVCGFIMLVPAAFMQAMSAFAAQNRGARKYDRAFKVLRYAIMVSTAFGIVMFYVNFFHGDMMSYIFAKDPEVIAAAIAGALTLVIVVSLLLKIFVFNPLEVGCLRFFRDNVTEPPAELGCIGEGFKNYMHTFITLFLQDLFVTLWTLLLIIPGFIKAYSYRLVPYLLSDRPDLSPTETLRLSSDLMRGHKWHAFCYDLSFIGWYILTALTLGLVGLFYAGPYKDSSDAALYLAIKGRH